MNKKNILILVYAVLLLIPIWTWVDNKGWEGSIFYGMVRLFGLVAFSLMTLQLIIGSEMSRLRPIFGAKLLKVHIWQGIIAFVLAYLHPVMLGLGFGFDQVLEFSPSFKTPGRVGLLFLTLAVLAGLFRTRPFMYKYWRWIHRLNYFALVMVGFHSYFGGSDVRIFPMSIYYLLLPGILLWVVVSKLRLTVKGQATRIDGNGNN